MSFNASEIRSSTTRSTWPSVQPLKPSVTTACSFSVEALSRLASGSGVTLGKLIDGAGEFHLAKAASICSRTRAASMSPKTAMTALAGAVSVV